MVQLAHPSPDSFLAPNVSISCCRSFNDLTFSNLYSRDDSADIILSGSIDSRGTTNYFDGITFRQPIYDSNNFIFAKCLSVQNNIDYVDLKEKIFKHSLSNIKNINALKKAIKRRYKKSLAHLSDKEKLSLGVAITESKIIKRF